MERVKEGISLGMGGSRLKHTSRRVSMECKCCNVIGENMPDGTWRVKSDHKNKHGENIWVLVHGVGILYRRSWDTAKGRTGEQARWQERGKKGDRRHVMRHTVHMRPATHSWLAAARKQEEKEEEEEEKEEALCLRRFLARVIPDPLESGSIVPQSKDA
jgi:hypothetical protein